MSKVLIMALRRSIGIVVLSGLSTWAAAQAFPTRPVVIYSGFPPGFLDVVLRHMLPVMNQELGQQVVIDFKVGAGGAVATDAVAKAAPDGHTLVFAEHSSAVYMHLLRKDLPYQPYRDLAIVSPVYKAGFIIVAHPSLKANTLAELIADAKARPGKITYAHSGNGTIHHLTMVLFQQKAGINMLAVPFKGGGPSRQAVAAGTTELAISGEDVTAALMKAGKIKPIALSTERRSSIHPDIPIIAEILPGFSSYSAGSIFAPVATPRPVLLKLNAAVVKALRDPETHKKLVGMALEAEPHSLEEGDKLWRREGELWAEVIRTSNIRLE